MNRRTLNIRILCISVLTAASLAAFSTAPAQAAEWTIGGQQLKELAKEELALGIGTLIRLNLFIFDIHCVFGHTHTTIRLNGVSDGNLKFSSCEVQDAKGNSASETCTVDENIVFEVKGLLSKDAMYDVFSSSSGTKFTTVTVENAPGKKCLLIEKSPEVLEVTGTLGALVSGNSLTFSEAIETAAETKLKFGSHTTFLEGSAKQELVGPFKGKELGAVK